MMMMISDKAIYIRFLLYVVLTECKEKCKRKLCAMNEEKVPVSRAEVPVETSVPGCGYNLTNIPMERKKCMHHTNHTKKETLLRTTSFLQQPPKTSPCCC